jgi:histidinol phosphatase-like PHP family hydrolase
MKRRTFIRKAGIAGTMLAAFPLACKTSPQTSYDFPLIDLHVHLTGSFTIKDLLSISKKTGVTFGVVVNPGYGVNDDVSLERFIDSLLPHNVYIGLQPMSPGWSGKFSPKVLSRLDYILMDAQTIPSGNGYKELLRIWNFDTYIDDAEQFMERYMAHTMEVINNNEPITTLGWPLFLPVCIARDYYTLWTDERMQAIISAAKKKNLNIEINDLSHTPHEKFINMAKEAGLKFTFGSDTRDSKAGRLDYCKFIAKKCNLKYEDFFIPQRVLNNN